MIVFVMIVPVLIVGVDDYDSCDCLVVTGLTPLLLLLLWWWWWWLPLPLFSVAGHWTLSSLEERRRNAEADLRSHGELLMEEIPFPSTVWMLLKPCK